MSHKDWCDFTSAIAIPEKREWRVKEWNPIYDEYFDSIGTGWIFCTNHLTFAEAVLWMLGHGNKNCFGLPATLFYCPCGHLASGENPYITDCPL